MELSSSAKNLRIATMLNNRGAEFFEAGNVQYAEYLFRESLTRFTMALRNDESSVEPAISPIGPQHNILVDTKSVFTPSDHGEAVFIPLSDPTSQEFVASMHKWASACCIFNLALVYHLRGLHSQRQLLFKAKTLYEKCARLMFDTGVCGYVSVSPWADILSMATLNNHAQVCAELGRFECAQQSTASLLHIASLVAKHTYACPKTASLMEKASRKFCLNGLLFQPPTTARAA